jgi:hypothetical protein
VIETSRPASPRIVAALLVPVLCVLAAGGSSTAGSPGRADTPGVVVFDLKGREADPFAGTGRLAVFLFVGSDCPVSNRYAPEIQRLASIFEPRGVAFRLIYPDRDATPDAIGSHLREYAYTLTALRDPAHAMVTLAGVRVTPEAAVFDRRQLVYRGRIDDRYVRFGVVRPAPSVRDLEQVLDGLLAGRPIEPFTRPAVGCLIETTP